MPEIVIKAPTGGIVKRTDYQSQPPFTSFDSLNYWPIDVKTGRITSATRPPLTQFGTSTAQATMLSRVSGISTLGPHQSFVAALNGALFYWNGSTMVAATGTQANAIDTTKYVSAAPMVNQLVIASGTGKPIVFNYVTGAAEFLVDSPAGVPSGSSIAVEWKGALWLATAASEPSRR